MLTYAKELVREATGASIGGKAGTAQVALLVQKYLLTTTKVQVLTQHPLDSCSMSVKSMASPARCKTCSILSPWLLWRLARRSWRCPLYLLYLNKSTDADVSSVSIGRGAGFAGGS